MIKTQETLMIYKGSSGFITQTRDCYVSRKNGVAHLVYGKRPIGPMRAARNRIKK
jgi:hypothetical protein